MKVLLKQHFIVQQKRKDKILLKLILEKDLVCLRTGDDVFFQRAELWGFSVMVDYWPRRLDLAALKAGNLAEVLNLAPWGNVLLQLPPLRLSGAHGWAALGAALGDHWLKDITTHQVTPR